MIEDEIQLVVDGVNCTSLGLTLVDRPLIPSPKIQYKEQEVIGGKGAVLQRFGYQDITYSITLNYLEELEKNTFKRVFREIRHWLYNGKTLQLTDEPEVSYQIKKVEIGDADNEIIEYGKFTINFTLTPFGKLSEKSPLVFTKGIEKKLYTFTNQSLYPSDPIIHLYGNGDCTLYLNDDEPIQFKKITNDIIVDSEKKLTYRKDGKLVINESGKQASNDYPILRVGANTMTVEGKQITKIEIWRNMLV